MSMTRRTFVQAAAAPVLAAGWPQTAAGDLSADRLVERIRGALDVPWREKTIDGFKAGDATTLVRGVAVTTAARLEGLRRAAAAGCNLVVTQEPVFYGPNDDPGNRGKDPVYLAKKAYIDEAGLIVWRFSDHWSARRPDPRVTALAEALGWKEPAAAGGNVFRIPETSMASLTAHVRSALGIRGGMRTLGPRNLRVRTVMVSPGTSDLGGAVAGLKDVDLVLAGEPREWEVVPYVLDARESGAAKALIAVGRIVSEEPGARACAAWIRSLVPGLRVETFPVGDPFWSPSP